MISCGCRLCVGIAIAATGKSDDRSGLFGPEDTLDPCEACRDDAHGEFRDLYNERTLLINENVQTRARTKPRTWHQVFAHHGEFYWGSYPNVVALHGGR